MAVDHQHISGVGHEHIAIFPHAPATDAALVVISGGFAGSHHRTAGSIPINAATLAVARWKIPFPFRNVIDQPHASRRGHDLSRRELDDDGPTLRHGIVIVIIRTKRPVISRRLRRRFAARQNVLRLRRPLQGFVHHQRDVRSHDASGQAVCQIPAFGPLLRHLHHGSLAQYLLDVARRLTPRHIVVRPDNHTARLDRQPVRVIDSVCTAAPRRRNPSSRQILTAILCRLLALDHQHDGIFVRHDLRKVKDRPWPRSAGTDVFAAVPDERTDDLGILLALRLPPGHGKHAVPMFIAIDRQAVRIAQPLHRTGDNERFRERDHGLLLLTVQHHALPTTRHRSLWVLQIYNRNFHCSNPSICSNASMAS